MNRSRTLLALAVLVLAGAVALWVPRYLDNEAFSAAWRMEVNAGPERATTAYRNYLRRFPNGRHTAEAKEGLARVDPAHATAGASADTSAARDPGGAPVSPPAVYTVHSMSPKPLAKVLEGPMSQDESLDVGPGERVLVLTVKIGKPAGVVPRFTFEDFVLKSPPSATKDPPGGKHPDAIRFVPSVPWTVSGPGYQTTVEGLGWTAATEVELELAFVVPATTRHTKLSFATPPFQKAPQVP